MAIKNPYLPAEAEILEIIEETPSIKTFVLKPKEEIGFQTGQFMELTVPGIGEAPFTQQAKKGEGERSGREHDKELVMQRLRDLGYW